MIPNSNDIPLFCLNCHRKYDRSIIPLELPCGHCYCEECVKEYESSHQKVQCFSENKVFNVKMSALKIPYFFKMIANLSYMCSKHKNQTIEFVCDEHKEFMCCLCLWDHTDGFIQKRN